MTRGCGELRSLAVRWGRRRDEAGGVMGPAAQWGRQCAGSFFFCIFTLVQNKKRPGQAAGSQFFSDLYCRTNVDVHGVRSFAQCMSLVICIQTIGCGFLFNSTLPRHNVRFTVQPNSGCQAHKRSVGSTTRYTVNFTKESLLSVWHLAMTCPNCRPQLVSRASCGFRKYENEIRLASGLD